MKVKLWLPITRNFVYVVLRRLRLCTTVRTSAPAAIETMRTTGRFVHGAQVELHGQCPPIVKMDATLGTLKACKCVFVMHHCH